MAPRRSEDVGFPGQSLRCGPAPGRTRFAFIGCLERAPALPPLGARHSRKSVRASSCTSLLIRGPPQASPGTSPTATQLRNGRRFRSDDSAVTRTVHGHLLVIKTEPLVKPAKSLAPPPARRLTRFQGDKAVSALAVFRKTFQP